MLLQHAPQPGIRPVNRIPQHKGARGTGVERGGDHLAGKLRLGGESHVGRNLRLGAPGSVLGPFLRQIQPTVNQRLTISTGVTEKHADRRSQVSLRLRPSAASPPILRTVLRLTVLNPPRRTGILPRHADRMAPLLHKTGFVNHQNTADIANRFNNIALNQVPQLVSVPV